jgi:hypothetical protein
MRIYQYRLVYDAHVAYLWREKNDTYLEEACLHPDNG